jgi:hypothetical protein
VEATLTVPNSDLVREACRQFDHENDVTETALAELFAAYPANDNPSHILLKVVALNSLYSTRILAVLKLAHFIANLGATLDAALAAGSPEAVTLIAHAGSGGSDPSFYTFATKYCNWHQPNLYPIYDSRVDKYLWALKKQGIFTCEALSDHQDLQSYPQFCVVMTAYREQFGLGSFTFKEIDKFLWSQGEVIWAVADEEAREEIRVEASVVFEEPPPIPEHPPVNAFGGAPAESAEAEVAAASQAAALDVIPVYEPDAELLRRRDESMKLFLDMFPSTLPPAADEPPGGPKP